MSDLAIKHVVHVWSCVLRGSNGLGLKWHTEASASGGSQEVHAHLMRVTSREHTPKFCRSQM